MFSNTTDNVDPDLNYNLFSDTFSSSCDYFTLAEYLELQNRNKFTILNHNIRSFSRNIDCLLACLPAQKMSNILCLTETRFSIDRTENISGYNGFHSVRISDTTSGGVSIFASCELQSNLVEALSYCNATIEVCTIEVKIGNQLFYLIGIYRPHSDTVFNFNLALSEFLNNSILNNKVCVLMGDLNICLLKDGEHTQSFMNILFSNHFTPLITKASRFSPVTGEAPSLLDHIWLNKFIPFSAGIIDVDITDHLPTFLNLNLEKPNNCEKIKVQFRDVNPANQNIFRGFLSSFAWPSLFSVNADAYLDRFVDTLNKLYCSAFPLRTKYVSLKHISNPWMTPQLRDLIECKSNYFVLCRNDVVTVSENNRYRNKVNGIIRKHKINFHKSLFLKHKYDMKATWKLINNILSRNSQPSTIKKIIVNNITYTESADLARVFNDFFCSVGSQIDSSIPLTSSDPLEYIVNSNSGSFFLNPVSSVEVSGHIKNLKNSKQNVDSISISILKENYDSQISLILADIINVCFSVGVFPENLKKAIVLPLYKKGERDLLTNYRPISLLPTFSKVFEKCIKSRLTQYFTDRNLLSSVQFGFQNNISTQDAIIYLVEKAYDNLNVKSSLLTIFIDFSKCFDSLNREILIQKLEAYGIRGLPLKLFISYLTNRKQAVKIGNQVSEFSLIETGVPQGSVLGPLLFLIYVNDLPLISNLFSSCLFADDTTLIFENVDKTDLITSCNIGLEKFSEWCRANRLAVNPAKTNSMLFSNVLKSEDIHNRIYLNNSNVQHASSVQFLGVEIDKKLKFKNHINNITNKISKNTGILYKLRSSVPTNTLVCIYRSFVESYLNYCPLVFGNAYRTHLIPLEVAQRKCVRIITNQHPQAHSNPIFANLKLLKVNDIFKLNLGTYMYKNLDKFSLNRHIHVHSTRSGFNQYIPSFQRLTLTLNQSIYYQVPANWNNIPDAIKECRSLKSFKFNYKNWILAAYDQT